MAPLADPDNPRVDGIPSKGAAMHSERLAIHLERPPLERMEACRGLYTLEESGESIVLRSAGYAVYVRLDEARELADAIYRYIGAIDGDKDRYVKAREWLGRKVRNGDIPGFEDARIRIETAKEGR